MSWGVSKRLKKILGFVDAPMDETLPNGESNGKVWSLKDKPNPFTNEPSQSWKGFDTKQPHSEALGNAADLARNVGENKMNNGSVNRIKPKGPTF